MATSSLCDKQPFMIPINRDSSPILSALYGVVDVSDVIRSEEVLE